MNDPRLPDALDRRIDDALRRRFAPPATLDSLVGRARPRADRRRVPWTLVLAATATAASLAMVAWALTRTRSAAPTSLEVVHRRGARAEPLVAEAIFCRIIGPVIEGLPEDGTLHSPDLVRLYRDMEACQREVPGDACADQDLASFLRSTYGQAFELRPEAAGVLQGPFGSDEWPTGTIVTGPSNWPTSSVLVADRGTTLDCCVRMKLPESSGLNVFTLQVGEVVLTEISPATEPWLLSYFE
jgi:hypothetical protein